MVYKTKVSVCITIFNESEDTVKKLLDALEKQTLKPDEIIIIDAKDYDNCSRAKGRNIAIGKAKNEIVAITDAGCVPDRNWLISLVKSFGPTSPKATKGADVVSGGYRMIAENSFQQAESIFLGVKSSDMDDGFMPSARSMAFTKSIWKKAGGFPEKLGNTAEDTLFNVELLKAGAKFVTAPKAIVDWEMPNTLSEFYKKIFNYAKGDAESKIWWHPVKKWRTHNLKIMTVFVRYAIGLWLLAIGRTDYLTIYLIIYSSFAFIKARFWGIALQFVSDFAVMAGFLRGILKLCVRI
jgi:cellulose synthase/poly-beta-1,6-N-acetylglucosamine synthase-like glycosyltransferase